MSISKQRPGPFAGPIFVAAVVVMAGAGTARAASCADLAAAFDKAVAERAVDSAIRSLGAIGGHPVCVRRIDEFRARLVDFLVDYASAPGVAPGERDKAIEAAEKTVHVSGNWQGKAKLGDYYFAHGNRPKAHEWYQLSVAVLATPGFTATDKERKDLMTRLAAAQSLANDDKGGQRRIAYTPTTRDVDGRLGGLYSPALVKVRGAAVVAIPIPINFVYNQTTLTPLGEQALQELTEAAKQAPSMTLVGHADPRGTPEYNMSLSQARVMAIRDRLVQSGVKAKIAVQWKGSQQPFDVSALPDAGKLSQEDIWQLDRRVEWVRDAEPE